MTNRRTRYQGAIIKDHNILLIKHCEHETGRAYWIFPGGGLELGETEEGCIKREMKEETGLYVRVKSLLMDDSDYSDAVYEHFKTYLCEVVDGDAKPGYEPETEVSNIYKIVEVKWIDLRSEEKWDSLLVNDPLTYLPLQRIRRKLDYLL